MITTLLSFPSHLPLLAMLTLATPATAQWSRVEEIPAGNIFSIDVRQDTIVAGAATAVFVSTDGGSTWRRSAPLAPAVAVVDAVRLHEGVLYAGTLGQGVFVSHDLGVSWSAFNQGLIGGVLNSQLFVSSFTVFGDVLYAGTLGAGVYARRLTGPGGWTHFGDVFEEEQASNVNAVAVDGRGRLLAAGGSNGTVFSRKRGDLDWTPSGLGPNGPISGVQAHSLLHTGSRWVVGTESGLFVGPTGTGPWVLSSLGIVSLRSAELTMHGHTPFAAFNVLQGAVIGSSSDDGASWQLLESLPGVFVFALASHGDELYSAQADGLWRSRRIRPL
jgi:hypothetical protein